MRRLNRAVGLLLAVLFAPLAVQAAGVNAWIGGAGDSNWTTAGNWLLTHSPTNLEDVVINGATVQLTNDTAILNGLLVTNNAKLYVYSPATNGTTAWGLLVNVTGTVTITSNSWIYPYSFNTNGGLPYNTNGGSAWFLCSNLVVGANSGFDANYKGFAGGTSSAQRGFGPGGTLASAIGSGGGGYGGRGGPGTGSSGGSTYGDFTNPASPGSGAGGGQIGPNMPGGAGGGLIRVLATDSVLVDGSLLANGQTIPNWYAGPGSGGGIYIQCRTFKGSGLLSAVGGDIQRMDGNMPGAGGGGRIAVVYDTVAQVGASPQPTVRFNAAAGNQNHASMTVSSAHLRRGYPGSLYLSDTQFFDLAKVQGGEILVPGLTSSALSMLSVSNGVIVCPTGFSLTVSQDVNLTAAGGIDLSNSVVSIGRDLILNSDSRGSVYFRGGPSQRLSVGRDLGLSKGLFEVYNQGATNLSVSVGGNVALTNYALANFYSGMTNGTVDYGMRVDVVDNMTIASNCWVYPYSHNTNGGSVYFQAANVTVNGGGGIDATAKGYRGGYQSAWGHGSGRSQGTAGRGPGGAGYGGMGNKGGQSFYGSGGSTYGSSNNPVDPGSGAGGVQAYFNSSDYGSTGGGLIHLLATGTVLVDGSLLANGETLGNAYPGCGSGGGIYIECRTFAGSGLLSANGGSSGRLGSANDFGGAGGGGRIAVWSLKPTNNWIGVAQANGGGGGASYPNNIGTNGTVVWGRLRDAGTVFVVH